MKKFAAVTNIDAVRSVLKKRYETDGVCTPFQEALELALLSEKRKASEFQCPFYSQFLPFEGFWDYIGHIPVYRNPDRPLPVYNVKQSRTFQEAFGNFYLEENVLFSKGMDVNIYSHLPYVNDGIHTHDHFELNYIYHGEGEFYFGEEHKVLKEGALLIIAPDSPHNVRAKGQDLILSVMVRKSTFEKVFWSLLNKDNVLASFFRSSLNEKNGENYLVFQTDNEESQQVYLQSLMVELNIKDTFFNNNMICILSLFLTTVLRKYGSTASFYDFGSLSAQQFDVNVLLQYIRQYYNTVTLTDVSEMFHYSESFFSRLIKKKLGKSFSDLVRELRLSHGQELLRQTGYTLRQICDIIGYDSVSAFSRAYKTKYGISPKEERNPGENL